MTPDEINIAIAGVCGFSNCLLPHQDEYQFLTDQESGIAMGRPVGRTLPTGLFEPIPDYHGDLNAMHEARRTLTEDQQVIYAAFLVGILEWDRTKNNVFRIADADPRIHAEAFLRVHNLWRE